MFSSLLFLVVVSVLVQSCQQANSAATDDSGTPEVTISGVAPGVWIHTSYYTYPDGARFPSNGLIVRDGKALILIDTAWGELRSVELLERIEREIRLPVRTAIITHSHYDRIAGVDVLERHGVRVLAHPHTRSLATKWGMPVPNESLAGLDAPGDVEPIGPVEVLYPGAGHAPDNLMVWVPRQQVLFGGCGVRAAASKSLGNLAHANTESWPEAIRMAQKRYREARIVVPGHGEAGGIELLAHTLELLEN